DFVFYGPDELRPDNNILETIKDFGKESGSNISFSSDDSCLKNATVIYTDIFASMGEEDMVSVKVNLLNNFKVTNEMLKKTYNPNILFMHCLPSFHDFETDFAKSQKKKGLDIREVADDVFEGKNSVVFDEAENRLHTIKAVLVAILSERLI
ncbi:MAG: ornithine carbamoyltransferase, partial [Clostridiales Family XIII bacterium]|nr:ornithine carbamoyltransferase [Clostridiales Family XIII bacterium]